MNNLLLAVLQVLLFGSIYALLSPESNQKRILFTRHGARSPNKYTELDQQYWGDFPPGYLTDRGFEQVRLLGKSKQHSHVVDDNGDCIYENLSIESSTKERVVMSTIAFITGLCPNNYNKIINRLFKEYFSKFTNETFTDLSHSNETQHLFSNFDRQNDFLFHGHSDEYCPKLKKIDKEIKQSKEYLAQEAVFKQRSEFNTVLRLMQESSPSLNLTADDLTINKMKSFYGGFKCNEFQGFPPTMDSTTELYLREIFVYRFYDVDNGQLQQQQSALTEMFKWILLQLDNDKFSWYSGHDSNQVALLSALVYEKLIPPFAADIELQISGDVVNLYFQGVRYRTKMCSAGFNCSIKDVRRYLEKFISPDLQQLCN